MDGRGVPGRRRGPAAQLQGDAYADADADAAADAHVAEKSTQRRGCSAPVRRCEARRRGSNGAARDALPMDVDTAARVTDAHDAERSTRCRVCSAPTRRCGRKRLARWRTTLGGRAGGFAGAPGKRTRAGFGEFPEDVVHERPVSVVCAAAPRVVWRSWQWPL